ncbi:hypothetical protein FGO68_gene6715 [Halteria grandinella]|uniref:Uncharacterized protein n=1 Tax=Halteria grandinella TaxID=5974 RepID=A0A8J8NR54_HALGN|nr:hypothetical protein FGO68_gene6715 [Halteria grandinella]
MSAVPKFYEDTLKIAYNATLGCGACIRGGYVYCIPGAEGSNSSSWGGKTAVCCLNSTCTQAKDKTYNCSSQYSDATQAKALCPFRTNACGNSSGFNFTNVGQSQNITINLTQGETCTFLIEATCGLPTIAPNDTTGFEVETLDYDEDDLKTTSRRMLQQGGQQGQGGKNFAANSSIPQPPKNITIIRDANKTQNNGTGRNKTTVLANGTVIAEKITGTQADKYNPSEDGSEKKFKGGAMNGANDTICKKRYSQVSVTALGNLTTSASSRILQSTTTTAATTYTMTLAVGTSDFATSESSFSIIIKAFSALIVTMGIILA